MIRFWDHAAVAPSPLGEPEGWSIELDGRPVRLPDGAKLRVKAHTLAEAIAAEWQAAGAAKGGTMSYADLPLTRLAGTAQQRIAPDPEPVILELAKYGESDLLCYRAGQPAELVRRQEQHWQPWLNWAADRYGARLKVTQGIVHVAQEPADLAALAAAVASLDAIRLAALGIAVPVTGSLVLGLAVVEQALRADEAHRVATVDEQFQAELWGVDEQADIRLRHIAEDLGHAARLVALSPAGAAR